MKTKTITSSLLFGIMIGSSTLFAQENVIGPTGKVGIGTTNPAEVLDVNGNVKIDSNLMIGGSINAALINDVDDFGTSEILFVDENGYILKGNSDDAILHLGQGIYSKYCSEDPFGDVQNPMWSNGVNKIYTDCPPVYVGINTNDPQVHLDVRGTTSTARIAVGVDPLSMDGKVHIKTNLSPGTSGTVLVAENSARKLLVLDNSGLLRAREIKVDVQAWPDYVFEEDYVLMPLAEVEQFIEQNGHLPNVPSAEEMELEGMNVLETNKLLLEKIEELTLYMIKQQKTIEAQNERLNQLETK